MLVYSSFSPLEQFDIIPLFNLTFSFFDFTITNTTSMSFFINSFATIIFFSLLKKNQKTFYIIPSNAQIIFETIYNLILSTLITNIGSKDGKPFLPVLYSVFLFIISSNLLGLIPYSFTLTSHMITTIFLSLFFFIGVNIICIRTHKFNFFSTFFPKNTSAILGLLIVPIEVISHIFKPLSLSLRLFINLMAGHTLLKVIAGFGWDLMSCNGVTFFLHYIPIFIIIPLFGLEFGIALIQAFVFILLCTGYLKSSLLLH